MTQVAAVQDAARAVLSTVDAFVAHFGGIKAAGSGLTDANALGSLEGRTGNVTRFGDSTAAAGRRFRIDTCVLAVVASRCRRRRCDSTDTMAVAHSNEDTARHPSVARVLVVGLARDNAIGIALGNPATLGLGTLVLTILFATEGGQTEKRTTRLEIRRCRGNFRGTGLGGGGSGSLIFLENFGIRMPRHGGGRVAIPRIAIAGGGGGFRNRFGSDFWRRTGFRRSGFWNRFGGNFRGRTRFRSSSFWNRFGSSFRCGCGSIVVLSTTSIPKGTSFRVGGTRIVGDRVDTRLHPGLPATVGIVTLDLTNIEVILSHVTRVAKKGNANGSGWKGQVSLEGLWQRRRGFPNLFVGVCVVKGTQRLVDTTVVDRVGSTGVGRVMGPAAFRLGTLFLADVGSTGFRSTFIAKGKGRGCHGHFGQFRGLGGNYLLLLLLFRLHFLFHHDGAWLNVGGTVGLGLTTTDKVTVGVPATFGLVTRLLARRG